MTELSSCHCVKPCLELILDILFWPKTDAQWSCLLSFGMPVMSIQIIESNWKKKAVVATWTSFLYSSIYKNCSFPNWIFYITFQKHSLKYLVFYFSFFLFYFLPGNVSSCHHDKNVLLWQNNHVPGFHPFLPQWQHILYDDDTAQKFQHIEITFALTDTVGCDASHHKI